MPCLSPLYGFSGEGGKIVFRPDQARGKAMTVACGGCLGCRLDKSREWAMRMSHEAMEHEENSFITLTYDAEHMPADGSLNKKHFQKFMKRLRKKFTGRTIRYYHCGEYGDQLRRPHYHACLFGLEFEDNELLKQQDGNKTYTSQVLADTWGMGFVTTAAFTFETAAYCARYITKKITGKKADEHYLRCDENGVAYWLEPEYSTMSRRPGIGAKWYEKYKDDLWPSDEVPVPGQGVFKKVPRYYETILKNNDLAQHEKIKAMRKAYAHKHKHEYTPKALMDKYKVKKAAISTLKRSYENEN